MEHELIRPPRALVLACAAILAGTAIVALATGATATGATAVTGATSRQVIVLLKDQPPVVSSRSAAFAARREQVLAAQAPVVAQLRAASTQVRSFQLVNAMAATVSADEEARLRADPAVATVIPDEVIHGPAAKAPAAQVPAATRVAPPGACRSDGKPLLEPEALQVTRTQSDDPRARTARSLGYTGAGVKVAYLADGIDVDNPDFIRADGSHVFTDYKDFTGDGTDAPTSGGEAFLDASSIAAQGRHSYNIQNFSGVPLAHPCTIRIAGVAPGVSLVGLKVYGQDNLTTTAGLLQAIDYATNVAKVDVLNESYGTAAFPDSATANAVKLFNNAAVRAGVTITASSGDSGPTNTIASPASDPNVISVGASTTYRFYAQVGGFGTELATGGWLNDNVSPLSSGGFTQAGRLIDLVAPGDSGWALCTPDTSRFGDCVNSSGQPSPIEYGGGTSEAAPLAAGAAALVIQAYRHAHAGRNPTPALVRKLLTGTADDLGHPAQLQGAGRLDTYQAVQAALSVRDANGSPSAVGSSILTSTSQLDSTAGPATAVTSTLSLTNNGARTQTVELAQRTLGEARDVRSGSVTLSDTTGLHDQGRNYRDLHIVIPANRDRLDIHYAFPGDPTAPWYSVVRVVLIDPKGRLAADSSPLSVSNAGYAGVRNPVAGSWTVRFFADDATNGGPTGVVRYKLATYDFQSTGRVTPSSLTLAPGASRNVVVRNATPSHPGDLANSLVIKPSQGEVSSVPIALRSLIDLAGGGRYSGTLTGGNGWYYAVGQTGYYQFDVPAGQKNVTADFTLSGGATDPVNGYLVNPEGNVVAYCANQDVTGLDGDGYPVADPISRMAMFAHAPAPGRWTLILNFNGAIAGTKVATRYSGNIRFDRVQASATGLPDGAGVILSAGKKVTIPVVIHNTSVAPQSFFIDPRLNTTTEVTLAQVAQGPYPLPMKPDSYSPQWIVPTRTSQIQIQMSATVPVTFDYGWLFGLGDPGLGATSRGRTADATYSANPVPAGFWFANPAEIGPFGPAGAQTTGSATATMTARTLAFDSAVSTAVGDFEASSIDPEAPFTVVDVQPGQSTTIPVTISPTGKKGTVVSGNLFVDALSAESVVGGVLSGQELTALPYAYTIG